MGLEPTTFCTAKAGGRSHLFAPVRSNLSFAATSRKATERERTRAHADCSHCSHGDRCHVQLAWPDGATPALATAADFRLGRDLSSGGQNCLQIRGRIYEPYALRALEVIGGVASRRDRDCESVAAGASRGRS
jgi:hypothetical protein